MDDSSDIRQGFLCPFCYQEHSDPAELVEHVQRAHPETDGDVLEQFKGFFDKAKRSIKNLDIGKLDATRLGIDISSISMPGLERGGGDGRVGGDGRSSSAERPRVRPPHTQHHTLPPPTPVIGVRRCLTSVFVDARAATVDEQATKTNMYILRLDRLINHCPDDVSKRKAFERDVVPWSADSESPCCRSCGSEFSLIRRRHHCRLCGRVICQSCSRFLSFLSARKLTNPAMAAAMEASLAAGDSPGDGEDGVSQQSVGRLSMGRAGERLAGVAQRSAGKMLSLVQRAGSRDGATGRDEVSLGSLLQQDADERLRVCSQCVHLLERRVAMMEQSNPPAVVALYETLSSKVDELEKLVPGYARMAHSLDEGETMYTLKAAEELRSRIAHKQREIDELSKRIAADDSSLGPKEQQLRRNVRVVALQALQGAVCAMPSLPSQSEYEERVEENKKRIAGQVEEARARNEGRMKVGVGEEKRHGGRGEDVVEASSSSPSVSGLSARHNSASPSRAAKPGVARSERRVGASADGGWTAQQTVAHNPFLDEQERLHPLTEQRDNLKGFLRQAAEAGRMDEVSSLEEALKSLEQEMDRLGLL